MSYRVIVSRQVEKFIKNQSRTIAFRLRSVINDLSVNPRPKGSKKLEGYKNEYRIRVGNIRILYTVDDDIVTVVVIKAGYRGDVYKR